MTTGGSTDLVNIYEGEFFFLYKIYIPLKNIPIHYCILKKYNHDCTHRNVFHILHVCPATTSAKYRKKFVTSKIQTMSVFSVSLEKNHIRHLFTN